METLLFVVGFLLGSLLGGYGYLQYDRRVNPPRRMAVELAPTPDPTGLGLEERAWLAVLARPRLHESGLAIGFSGCVHQWGFEHPITQGYLLALVRAAYRNPDLDLFPGPPEFGKERAWWMQILGPDQPPMYRSTRVETLVAALEVAPLEGWAPAKECKDES